jgi:hypothetical protein
MKEGHQANDCWWRYDDDDGDIPNDNSKGAYGVDTNWYMDTCATNHVRGRLNKLQVHEKYQGVIKFTMLVGKVCALLALVIQFCTPCIVPCISKIFFMSLLLP